MRYPERVPDPARPRIRSRASLRAGLAAGLLCGACSPGSAASSPPSAAPTPVAEAVEPALRHRAEPLPLLRVGGGEADLRTEAAQVTVVELWATYCGPCIQRLPEYDAMRQRYAEDPRVRFIAVSIDGPGNHAKARAILRERAPTLPAYFDPDGAVTAWLMPRNRNDEQVTILPMLAIVDAESRVHRRVDVEQDRTGFAFDEVVQLALEGQMPPSMRNIHAQRNQPQFEPRQGLQMMIAPDPTPEQIDGFIEQLEQIYRRDPDFDDALIERRLAEIRVRIERGERRFEPDFSKEPPR